MGRQKNRKQMSNKPFEPYKIDQSFGNPTSYGPHEGLDMNGLGGGNTDCLTHLKAMFSGTIVHVSSSTKDYGNLAVLDVVLGGKHYYIRYCHCHAVHVREGQVVKQGDVIALMGSTGNSQACHLHLDILKKIPSHWRYFAKTTATHNEYFIDPIEIMNNFKESDMPDTGIEELKDKLKWYETEYPLEQQRVRDARTERDDLQKELENMSLEHKKEIADLVTQLTTHKTEAEEQRKELKDLIAWFADLYGTTQEVPRIKARGTESIGFEDLLVKERKDHDFTRSELTTAQTQNTNFNNEIKDLKEELRVAKGLKDATKIELLTELLSRLIKIKRG